MFDRLIDPDHVARRIWRVVDSLDLSRFERDIRAVESVADGPSHSPEVLISVWLWIPTRAASSLAPARDNTSPPPANPLARLSLWP